MPEKPLREKLSRIPVLKNSTLTKEEELEAVSELQWDKWYSENPDIPHF